MITSIYNTGPYLSVSNPSPPPYVNPSSPSAGMVRYHNSQMQVYDGTSWLAVGGAVNIGLSGEADSLLNWVRKKRDEEAEARRMAEQYPAVADALGAVREAEEQLKTVVALCRI